MAAVNSQQLNAITRVQDSVSALKEAYYKLLKDKDTLALIGIPVAGDFPLVGPSGPVTSLDYVTRQRLVMVTFAVDALKVFFDTAVDLDGAGAAPNKKPLDAFVEVLP